MKISKYKNKQPSELTLPSINTRASLIYKHPSEKKFGNNQNYNSNVEGPPKRIVFKDQYYAYYPEFSDYEPCINGTVK